MRNLSPLAFAGFLALLLAAYWGGSALAREGASRNRPLETRKDPPPLAPLAPGLSAPAVEVRTRPEPVQDRSAANPLDSRAAKVLAVPLESRRVSGQVLDLLGEAQVDASVELWLAAGQETNAPLVVLVARTVTDAAGQFEVPSTLDLAAVYALSIRPVNRASAIERGIVGARPDTWTRDIRVRGGVPVLGQVRDAQGQPLGGVRVSLFDLMESTHSPMDPERVMDTAADGSFELPAVSPGRKRVRFATRGCLEAELNPVVVPEGTPVRGLLAQLSAGREVRGRVSLASSGVALARRRIELRPSYLPEATEAGATSTRGARFFPTKNASDTASRWSAISDEAGAFTFPGVPKQALLLTVFDPGGAPLHAEPIDADETDLNLQVSGFATVTGRVVDQEGRAVTSFRVSLGRDSTLVPAQPGPAEQHEDGQYELSAREPGRWFVMAHAPGFAPAVSGPIELGKDESRHGIHVALQPASAVLGRVLANQGPLAGATVLLYEVSDHASLGRPAHGARPLGRLRGRAATESDGSFLIPSGARGRFQIEVTHPSCVPSVSEPRELPVGAVFPWGDVRMEAAASVSGLVMDLLGAPDAQAIVAAIPEDVAAMRQVAPTDGEGRFRLGSLPEGTWRLVVIQARGLLRPSAEAEGTQDRVVLRAGETRSVELRLDR